MNLSRRHALFLLGGSLALSTRSFGCAWDTDTLRDELNSSATTFDLITGQFPHHGDAYYTLRISRLSKQKELSITDLNDLAVAHLRLQQFDKAESYLNKALTQQPNHYETLSNIGVTAKKQGDFKKGAEYIAKALGIKAEGHMGLGDWYLKALKWRAQNENKKNPTHNFLGTAYADLQLDHFGMEFMVEGVKNDIKQSMMMVKNDQSFADGFLHLGDHLISKGHLNLAFLAHTKAMTLQHQNPNEIRRRRKAFLNHFQTFPNGHKAEQEKPWGKGIERAEKLLTKGTEWLDQFKSVEASLLKGLSNEKEITFTKVKAQMKTEGIKKMQELK